LSRKGMLGEITGRDVTQRDVASAAAAMIAAGNGASVVRVHDVAGTVDALAVVNAVAEL
jgi:dihydropteroate synthase